MADIKVIKLKVRRGPNSQRKQVILDQGELGFTTDTARMFVGTGTLSGGVVVGNKIHQPLTLYSSLTNLPAEIGDCATALNKFYQLTATNYSELSSWATIGTKSNTTYLDYDTNGILTIVDKSIDSTKLNNSLSSTSITLSGTQLVVNYNTSQFTISGGKFSLTPGSSTEFSGDGLQGGGTVPLSAKPDGITIGFNATTRALEVISTPLTALRMDQLSGGFIKDPITNQVNTIVQGVDPASFALSGAGVITLNGGISASNKELPFLTINDKGLVQSAASSIYDILSCNDSALSSYNGAPNQKTINYQPSNGRTIIDVISSNSGTTVNFSLSSAGFIVFEGGSPTRRNANHIPTRFAIPVFTF